MRQAKRGTRTFALSSQLEFARLVIEYDRQVTQFRLLTMLPFWNGRPRNTQTFVSAISNAVRHSHKSQSNCWRMPSAEAKSSDATLPGFRPVLARPGLDHLASR